MKISPSPPFYPSLQAYLDENRITDITPMVIRKAVIAIRKAKLPDPGVIANNGSFFANPIVDHNWLNILKDKYPQLVYWPQEDSGIKLSAAWLIEQAGFRNYHDTETGMATWPNQSLILINEHAKSTSDLLKFKQKIVDAVRDKFGVVLEQEPELMP